MPNGYLACLVILLFSCITLKNQKTNLKLNTNYNQNNVQPTANEQAYNLSDDVQIDTNDLDMKDALEDIIEEAFCHDDIYASYLQKKFYQQNKYKNVRRKKKHIKTQAIFYARNILIGPSEAKFGGIPVVSNPNINFWITYYQTKGRHTFIKWLIRGESFKEIVIPILKQEGMPTELFFLAMIESGFNNKAYSKNRATGTWQFMKNTAKLYNLKIDYWVDERKDPVKSTIAAIRYLKDLYIRFEDWYLAMAAYNAGEGKIAKAIRLAKTKDFWQLCKTRYIKTETKNYVPKILAALTIASDPKKFGFEFTINPNDKMPTTTIQINRPISLTELASKLGLSYNILKQWNPHILRDITPPLKKNAYYNLRLSPLYVKKFEDIKHLLSTINISDVMIYTVKKNDTVYNIAKKFKVRIADILKHNPNLNPRYLAIKSKIVIPIPTINISSTNDAKKNKG